MKIVLLAKFLRKDGASTHIYTLAENFDSRGHEVHIISAGPTKDKNAIDLFNRSINRKVKHHRVIFPCYAKFDLVHKILQLIRYIFAIPQVIFIMIKIKPDIINVHYPVTSYIAKIYCKLFGGKFVTTYHITGIGKQILHKKADAAIAISSELRNEIRDRWGYKEEEIYTVFNGVDRKRFDKNISEESRQELKDKFNIPKDKVIIGFVGTYEHKKGIDLLIEACSKIDENKYHLILVGDGDIEWLRENVDKFKIKNNITLQYFQDPVDLYSIFDIFVLPSRNEGFPLVALEAMMMGVPTIRSNVSGANDMIKHKIDGYIFNNLNVVELREYIEELIENNELRKRIGNEGKKKAINNFSEEVMINNMIRAYEDIIRRKK